MQRDSFCQPLSNYNKLKARYGTPEVSMTTVYSYLLGCIARELMATVHRTTQTVTKELLISFAASTVALTVEKVETK